MNNDVPETLAAARSRAADLEQQLKLSDEGVSRLAQRCLELEQQVLNYQAHWQGTAATTSLLPSPCRSCSTILAPAIPRGNA